MRIRAACGGGAASRSLRTGHIGSRDGCPTSAPGGHCGARVSRAFQLEARSEGPVRRRCPASPPATPWQTSRSTAEDPPSDTSRAQRRSHRTGEMRGYGSRAAAVPLLTLSDARPFESVELFGQTMSRVASPGKRALKVVSANRSYTAPSTAPEGRQRTALLPPLRGLGVEGPGIPGADAPGSSVSPLRGFSRAGRSESPGEHAVHVAPTGLRTQPTELAFTHDHTLPPHHHRSQPLL